MLERIPPLYTVQSNGVTTIADFKTLNYLHDGGAITKEEYFSALETATKEVYAMMDNKGNLHFIED